MIKINGKQYCFDLDVNLDCENMARRGFILVAVILIIFSAILTIDRFVYVCHAKGISMEPTIWNNDCIIMEYYNGQALKRDDVVSIVPKDKLPFAIVKRVIAIPGDTIRIADGKVYINGEELYEPYIKEPMTDDEEIYVRVGKDEIFTMGDNRNASCDSRYFGTFKIGDIKGKCIFSFGL